MDASGEGIHTSLQGLVESVLPFRTPDYISGFLEKLLGEGISQPSDLLRTSKEALEKKLSTHASFNFIEMADVMSLTDSARRINDPDSGERDRRNGKGEGRGQPPRRRQRSRSLPSRPHGRYLSRSPPPYRRGGRRGGRRDGSRPYRRERSYEHYDRPDRGGRSKPELWAAVEKGDQALVAELLEQGADPEERHLTWSPLMKAAEEGHAGIMQLLLDKNVDLEAVNRKGRSALSFAAAPSMKRPTATSTLRLLLQAGADTSRFDSNGQTAKARATMEDRQEAVIIFEEFEAKVAASPTPFRMKVEPSGSA
mmetsp:Transcript_102458/g.168393  ORF Transcript_102458/g.168393 Transcript_102458/m.168393 type:complete len:310 (-) Transcript_102458:118-1047(-)